jgi:hypothetical protein
VKRAYTCARPSRRDGIAEAVSRRPRCGCRRGCCQQPLRFSLLRRSLVASIDPIEPRLRQRRRPTRRIHFRARCSREAKQFACVGGTIRIRMKHRARARKRWRPVSLAPSRYAARCYSSRSILSRGVDRTTVE